MNDCRHSRIRSLGAVCTLGAAVLVGGCATQPSGKRTGVPELMPGVSAGYLAKDQHPDSLKLLPPPPAAGSAGMAFDEEIRRRAVAMRGSARWELARQDADLHPARTVQAFECSLGIAITAQQTPRLAQMLQRVAVDAGLSTEGAKKKYQRTRPFVAHGEPMCTPEEDATLRADGSYPSGHTALGWGSALALAQVAPEHGDAILARGRSFGESRLVCNVHWQSDVISGRVIASATFARVNAMPEFVEDVAVARVEIAAARASGAKPTRDCAAEAGALAQRLEGAL